MTDFNTIQRFDTIGTMKKQKTIADLQPGESGWIVPWVLTYDNEGCVNGFSKKFNGINAPVHRNQGGTAEVYIILRSENDYVFDLTKAKEYQFLDETD